MSAYSKKEIIEGIINTNRDIYQYLDTEYRERVIRYVTNNSGTREDGEELYQDIIFEIYLNIKRGRYRADESGAFEKYFWTIVTRRWIDKLRKQKLNFDELEASEIPYKTETEEVDEYLKNKRILAIRKYLEQLSSDEREYIRLNYAENKPNQAIIAEYIGTTHGNFRKKLCKIRKKLRKMIADDPEFGASLFKS